MFHSILIYKLKEEFKFLNRYFSELSNIKITIDRKIISELIANIFNVIENKAELSNRVIFCNTEKIAIH